MTGPDDVLILGPIFGGGFQVTLFDWGAILLAAFVEMIGGPHSAHHRADQKQAFDHLRMGQREINGESAAGRIAHDDGAMDTEVSE